MAEPPAASDPPDNHQEWIEAAHDRLTETDITALFQALHHDSGISFVLSDTDATTQVSPDQQSDLLAAHLTALAAATEQTVEDVAAAAVKQSRALSEDGLWSDLAVTQSSPGPPALCLGCGRPAGDAATDTSFDAVPNQDRTWECSACGSTTTTPRSDVEASE